jgi:hypothetical protein
VQAEKQPLVAAAAIASIQAIDVHDAGPGYTKVSPLSNLAQEWPRQDNALPSKVLQGKYALELYNQGIALLVKRQAVDHASAAIDATPKCLLCRQQVQISAFSLHCMECFPAATIKDILAMGGKDQVAVH